MAKQTFGELFASLPVVEQNRLIIRIMDACNVSIWTVQSWYKGTRTPRLRNMEIIADFLGKSPLELFPVKYEKATRRKQSEVAGTNESVKRGPGRPRKKKE